MELKKFRLRPWTMRDLKSLVKHANNHHISRFMTDQFPHPYSTATGKAYLNFAMSAKPVRIFCIEVNGEAAGGIGIHPQNDIQAKNAELGYWLAEPFWGQGIVTEAIKITVDFGFKNFDINRIFARPFGSNLASQRVLEKAGFFLEAKLIQTLFKEGVFEDELIYCIRRD